MRRFAAVGAAIAIGALAIASAVPASSDQGSVRHRTIEVVGIGTEENFVDLGDAGPSLGDELVFHEDLRVDGKTVGHDGGVCSATSLEEGTQGEFQCVVTLWFANGQIASQGLIQPSGESPEKFEVVITGGSGAYEGAGGHIKVVEVSETRTRMTLFVQTPD